MGQSPQYVEHALERDGRPWAAPHPYVIGVRVTWHPWAWGDERRGHCKPPAPRLELPVPEIEGPLRLVCLTDHYAGDRADHPWDPGAGWDPERAALLWVPDGEVEAARFRALINCLRDDRAHSPGRLVEMRGPALARWVFLHTDRLVAIGEELLRRPIRGT